MILKEVQLFRESKPLILQAEYKTREGNGWRPPGGALLAIDAALLGLWQIANLGLAANTAGTKSLWLRV